MKILFLLIALVSCAAAAKLSPGDISDFPTYFTENAKGGISNRGKDVTRYSKLDDTAKATVNMVAAQCDAGDWSDAKEAAKRGVPKVYRDSIDEARDNFGAITHLVINILSGRQPA